ncbi:hypothetical protein HK100_005145, partial [Physocladia obscura]
NLTDVSCLTRLPQLEVVSLPVNRISDLSAFSALDNLNELYLRKNEISDPRQLMYLVQLPLTHLWISENPICEKIPNYRVNMIRLFPKLSKLDDKEITDRERRDAAKLSQNSSPTSSSMPSSNSVSPQTVELPKNFGQQPSLVFNKQANNSSDNDGDTESTRVFERYQQQQQHELEQLQQQLQQTRKLVSRQSQIQSQSNVSKEQKQYLNFRPSNERNNEPTSSDEEELRLQMELLRLKRQRRRTVDPPVSKFNIAQENDRPIKSRAQDDHVIGQGLNGALYSPPTQKNAKPSYTSKIVAEKQFQDHLNVQRGGAAAVVQMPIDRNYSNTRKKAFEASSSSQTRIAGAGATLQPRNNFSTDFRRRGVGDDGNDGPRREHVFGAGARVNIVDAVSQDYRMKTVDFRPSLREEQHITGAIMAVENRADFHNPRIGQLKYSNLHVVGSGVKVVADEDFEDFPVIEVTNQSKFLKENHQQQFDMDRMVRPKPDWSQEQQSKNNLLQAAFSIVRDLDRQSLQVLSREINQMLEI